MTLGKLEHVNLTVSDPDRTAKMLEDVFGWTVRWKGPSLGGGYTVHVGTEDDYVALYANPKSEAREGDSFTLVGAVNHLGVLVDDLSVLEARVKQAGLTPVNHQTYEPGSRFYFFDQDKIEYEVVSYA
ncbi:MAG: VOC family protein [Pseudomonadota bacterium]